MFTSQSNGPPFSSNEHTLVLISGSFLRLAKDRSCSEVCLLKWAMSAMLPDASSCLVKAVTLLNLGFGEFKIYFHSDQNFLIIHLGVV